MNRCVLFVSSMSAIVFNQSAGAITDRSQSAKDIDTYLGSSSMCRTGHLKPVLILSNWLSKPGERAHDRNFISAVGRIGNHNR